SLEQTRQINDRINSLLSIQSSTQAIGLIGRTVEVATATGSVVGQVTTLTFQQGTPFLTVQTNTAQALAGRGLDHINHAHYGRAADPASAIFPERPPRHQENAMLDSIYVGLTGLLGFSRDLTIIGNNVANLNTPGFKSSQLLFSDLFYRSQFSDNNREGTNARL